MPNSFFDQAPLPAPNMIHSRDDVYAALGKIVAWERADPLAIPDHSDEDSETSDNDNDDWLERTIEQEREQDRLRRLQDRLRRAGTPAETWQEELARVGQTKWDEFAELDGEYFERCFMGKEDVRYLHKLPETIAARPKHQHQVVPLKSAPATTHPIATPTRSRGVKRERE